MVIKGFKSQQIEKIKLVELSPPKTPPKKESCYHSLTQDALDTGARSIEVCVVCGERFVKS